MAGGPSFQERVEKRRRELAGGEGGPQAPAPGAPAPGAPAPGAPALPPGNSFQASVDARRAELEAQRNSGVVGDALKGAGSGVVRGIVGIGGAPTDIYQGLQKGWLDLQENLYGPEHRAKLEAQIAGQPDKVWPSGEDFRQDAVKRIPALDPVINYQPTGKAGHYGQIVGEFVGGAGPTSVMGALRQVGPLSAKGVALIKELIAQGVAPAAISEGTGYTLEQLGLEKWADIGRIVGGAVGGAAGAKAMGPERTAATIDLPGVGPTRTAAAIRAGQAIEDTGGPTRVRAELNAVGPEATLSDVSPRLRGQTEGLYTKPGPQQQTIRDFLTQRLASLRGENSLLNSALDRVIAPREGNFADMTENLRDARRQRAQALYGEAERLVGNQPVDQSRAATFIDTLVPDAVRQGRLEALPEHRAWMELGDYARGEHGYTSSTQLRDLLTDRIDKTKRAGGSTRDLETARTFVNEALENASRRPDNTSAYGEATRAYKTDSDIVDAVNNGRELFKRAERPDEFQRRWRDMSDEERTAFRIGARDSINELMGPATNDWSQGMNNLRSDWSQQKLRIMLGNDEAAAFNARLEGLVRQQGTHQKIESASATAGRQQGQKEIPDVEGVKVKAPLTEAPTWDQAVIGGLKKLYEKFAPDFVQGRNRAENISHARIMTAPDPGAFLSQLDQVYRARGEKRLPPGGPSLVGGYGAYQQQLMDEEERRRREAEGR